MRAPQLRAARLALRVLRGEVLRALTKGAVVPKPCDRFQMRGTPRLRAARLALRVLRGEVLRALTKEPCDRFQMRGTPRLRAARLALRVLRGEVLRALAKGTVVPTPPCIMSHMRDPRSRLLAMCI
jgi:hypothetical protein